MAHPDKIGIAKAAEIAQTSRIAVATAVTNGDLPREVENGKAKFEPEAVQAWAQKRQETHSERWERQAKEARETLRQQALRQNNAAGGFASQVIAQRENAEASVRRLNEYRENQIPPPRVPTPASRVLDALAAQLAELRAKVDALEAERKG
jgi:hypothetical protein